LARVRLPFATRIRSGADNGAPELSTVRLFVLTETIVPESDALRTPPINKLSAPKAVSCAESRTTSPAAPVTPGPAIRISSGLLISTHAPRPPLRMLERTLPWIYIAAVHLNNKDTESIGRSVTVASCPSAPALKNWLAKKSSYCARVRMIAPDAISNAEKSGDASGEANPLKR